MDKDITRRVWAQSGIPVARGFVATDVSQAEEILELLGRDVVVKPSGEGSSVGLPLRFVYLSFIYLLFFVL
jgi:D-alanine-D-alanine ligase-like ATP-grasp enzyme